MKATAILALGALLCGPAAQAQITYVTPGDDALKAPRVMRQRGPALAPALLAAETAVSVCTNKGYEVSAVVVDSTGAVVVMLSGNGASVLSQTVALGAAMSSVKNGMPSMDLAKAADTDKALAAKLVADPLEGPPRAGGLPIKVGGEVIGAIAVSGAITGGGRPAPEMDSTCAQAGLDKVNAKGRKP